MNTLFDKQETCAICHMKRLCGGVLGVSSDVSGEPEVKPESDLGPEEREKLLAEKPYSVEAYICENCSKFHGEGLPLSDFFYWLGSAVAVIILLLELIISGGRRIWLWLLILPLIMYMAGGCGLVDKAKPGNPKQRKRMKMLALTPAGLITIPLMMRTATQRNRILTALKPKIPDLFKKKYAEEREQVRLANRTPEQVCREEGHQWKPDWTQQGINEETGVSWNDEYEYCKRCGLARITLRTIRNGEVQEEKTKNSKRVPRPEPEKMGERLFCSHLWEYICTCRQTTEETDIRSTTEYYQCAACGAVRIEDDDDALGFSVKIVPPERGRVLAKTLRKNYCGDPSD